MASVRQIIKHVTVEYAKGERGCKRNRNHRIPVGSPCLVIQEPGGPFKKCYCQECALPILQSCAATLRDIRDSLYGMDFDGRTATVETLGAQLVKANRQRSQEKKRSQFQVTEYAPTEIALEPVAVGEKSYQKQK